VTASPGGRTRTAGHGGFELEALVPRRTAGVELSIRSPGTGGARTYVPLPAGATEVDLGSIRLDPEPPGQPHWVPTFGPEPGVSNSVRELVVFDDGGGPALYLGGFFRTAGGQPANAVVKWDGHAWSPLGDGPGADVQTLAVFDDGTGPALYAGLYPRSGFPTPQHWVMKWNGSTWQPLASDLDGAVEDLAVFDDGGGPRLYAAGRFTHAGGTPIPYLARWDGTSWSAVGEAPDSVVRVLEVVDLGSGPALYVGGFFTHVGGLLVNRIARWNGSWSALSTGRGGPVAAITGYDAGSGTELFVGGSFGGGVSRWTGTSWASVSGGLAGDVTTLQGFDDGTGPKLYASGLFSGNLRRWGGNAWGVVGGGLSNYASDLAVFDDGTGPELVIGGNFRGAGDRSVSHVATWGPGGYRSLEEDAGGLNSSVRSLATFDHGQGEELYVGGFIDPFPERQGVDGLARWDGAGWSPVGSGVAGVVHSMVVHDDGNGEALFVGGSLFTNLVSIGNVAAWNGTSWSMLDGAVDFIVQALARYDAGSGMELYAAGGFLANNARISRWDGLHWTQMGVFDDECHALLAFDAGAGSELYAAGSFQHVDGLAASRIARWNGAAWAPLGAGLDGPVLALAVFDSGAGPRLVAGGEFTAAGGQPAAGLARWDGTAWAPLGGGVGGSVTSLTVLEGALYAGGAFSTAGGVPAEGIARFDGVGWEPLGGGVFLTPRLEPFSPPFALLGRLDHGRPELLVGGGFSSVPESGDSYLALWGGRSVCVGFETEDDFETPLVNGQAIDAGEFGRLFTLSGAGPNAGAAIFDSTPGGPNDPSQDPDLLAGTGNVLILQTDAARSQTVPGIFDRPNDDENGGVLTFAFTAPVRLVDLALLDIDDGSDEATYVIQVDGAGRRRTQTVPPGWTGDLRTGAPGRLRLALSHLNPQPGHASTVTAVEDPGFAPDQVVSLEVWLGSSGAVDDLCFEPTR